MTNTNVAIKIINKPIKRNIASTDCGNKYRKDFSKA